jgi:hypothetical protein
MVKIKVKNKKKKAGRPRKITEEIVGKLEFTASLDCTVSEMCFYAAINRDTYYNWIKKDKRLSDRLTALRNKPILKARQTFVGALSEPKYALEYLERKLPDEFGLRQKIEHKGQIMSIAQIVQIVNGNNGNNNDKQAGIQTGKRFNEEMG